MIMTREKLYGMAKILQLMDPATKSSSKFLLNYYINIYQRLGTFELVADMLIRVASFFTFWNDSGQGWLLNLEE
jgi:hypothetical protein